MKARRIAVVLSFLVVFLVGYTIGANSGRYEYVSGPSGVPLKVDKRTGNSWALIPGQEPIPFGEHRPEPPTIADRVKDAYYAIYDRFNPPPEPHPSGNPFRMFTPDED